MSCWCYVDGIVNIELNHGNSQEECDQTMEKMIEELPKITGSELNAKVTYFAHDGYTWFSSTFGECQAQYTITFNGSLRDKLYGETMQEIQRVLQKILNYATIDLVLMKVEGYMEVTYDYVSKVICKEDICSNKIDLES